ncbi:MAG: hypothetical protein ACTFAL_05055 [Candidatus Electronema sp. V4]
MPNFDELNKKRGIAQYCSEASKATEAAINTKGIVSLLSAKEDLSGGYAAMATLDELNQKKGIARSSLEEASKLVEEIEKIDGLFSGKGNELSYEKAAAGMGAIGDFDNSIYHTDFIEEKYRKMVNKEESKAREKLH